MKSESYISVYSDGNVIGAKCRLCAKKVAIWFEEETFADMCTDVFRHLSQEHPYVPLDSYTYNG